MRQLREVRNKALAFCTFYFGNHVVYLEPNFTFHFVAIVGSPNFWCFVI